MARRTPRLRASALLSWGAIVFGLIDLAIFLYPLGYAKVWPAAVGMIIVGIPGALCVAGLITLFQRSSDDSYRGRVFGAISTLEGVTILAGTLGAGYLSQYAGIIAVLAIQGAGYVVAGFAMLLWLADGAEPHHFEQLLARDEAVHMHLRALVHLPDSDQPQVGLGCDRPHLGDRIDLKHLVALALG